MEVKQQSFVMYKRKSKENRPDTIHQLKKKNLEDTLKLLLYKHCQTLCLCQTVLLKVIAFT